MTHSEIMLIAFNAALCLAGAAICVCRMAHMSERFTKPAIRVQYALWVAFFALSAITWTFDDLTAAQVILTALALGHLLLGVQAWRFGAPSYTLRGHYEAMGD